MIESLNDRYSGFLTPEMLADMEKQLGGKLVGIRAQLEMHGKQIRVVTPLDDSPALKAGIQPGDVILQIDDQPAAGLELAEAVKRITGTQGTAVRLRISRGGQELDVAATPPRSRCQRSRASAAGATTTGISCLMPVVRWVTCRSRTLRQPRHKRCKR